MNNLENKIGIEKALECKGNESNRWGAYVPLYHCHYKGICADKVLASKEIIERWYENYKEPIYLCAGVVPRLIKEGKLKIKYVGKELK